MDRYAQFPFLSSLALALLAAKLLLFAEFAGSHKQKRRGGRHFGIGAAILADQDESSSVKAAVTVQ
jgi:hypothetical protein